MKTQHAPCGTCTRRNDEGEVCRNGDTSCYPPDWSGWKPFECTMDEKCPCEDCRKERQWPADR